MEKGLATSKREIEQLEPVVQVGSVVAVEFGADGHQRVFVVTNADRELPDGITQDMLPEGMMLAPETMPLIKDIAGKPTGYSIKPVEINSKNFPAYKREGVTIIGINPSVEDFLASNDDDGQDQSDDKTD